MSPDAPQPPENDLSCRTIEAMQALFGHDQRRIDHALNVLRHAEDINRHEPGCPIVVTAAAILHDIGIPAAETKYHSSAPRYQQLEGPPVAREIMLRLGYDLPTIDHVCRIIANHHTARNIDTPEFRIIWDADWLVNLPEEHPDLAPENLRRLIPRIFKTPYAHNKAIALFLT